MSDIESTGIRLTLVDAKEWTGIDGRFHRREQWTIEGGEIDPAWRPRSGEKPSSRFTLYVVDGEVDLRLASYGGTVWPTAWPDLFCGNRRPGSRAFVEITDEGLMLREAALHGASCVDADARLLP